MVGLQSFVQSPFPDMDVSPVTFVALKTLPKKLKQAFHQSFVIAETLLFSCVALFRAVETLSCAINQFEALSYSGHTPTPHRLAPSIILSVIAFAIPTMEVT
jgi:hypothetical protein